VLPLPLLSINHPKLTFLNWYFPNFSIKRPSFLFKSLFEYLKLVVIKGFPLR
jgi:hypothetical protein